MSINKNLLIPLTAFVLLVIVLAFGFRLEDPHYLPSELINRPFPEFSLQDLHDPDRTLTVADIKGKVSLVNVWATWCPNCLVEHPELIRISQEEGIALYGVNYNDESSKAIAWLERHGNPYKFTNPEEHLTQFGLTSIQTSCHFGQGAVPRNGILWRKTRHKSGRFRALFVFCAGLGRG